MPGEELEKGIQNIPVLNEHQNLLVRATNFYKDPKGKEYLPGESFVVKGPCEFIPYNVEIL